MENTVRKEKTDSLFSQVFLSEATAAEKSASSTKKAAAKKPDKKTEEPKKEIWPSVLFGLASGILSFFINVLPEKIGKYLSHVFSSMVKAENPFIKEAK